MAKQRSPYDVRLDDEQRKRLALYLCDEVQAGLDARAASERDVDYWHALYEQSRTRGPQNAPWPDAADLTSYLASEKVDSLHARLVRTVLGVEPIYTVEGFGDAAARAPIVEEITQWKCEEGRIQNIIDKWAQIALIEPRGLLEVYEGTEMRTVRKTIRAKVQTYPMTGGIAYDEQMQPMLEMGPDGKYVEAGPQDVAAKMVVDETQRVRTGPVERILPYRDSLILPAHARDKDEIWGYGKRLWKRQTQLERNAESGLYDKDAVERMSSNQDRESIPSLERSGVTIAPQKEGAAEKELWELLVLLDLNELFESYGMAELGEEYDGERWYLCTVHLNSQQLLRIQHDDLERSRFVPVILFPRPDRCTEGFSFIGHKLITTIEEHTAWRNMAADRAAMVVQAPIKRQMGALWDPMEIPWGPKSVIDVRSMDEIQPIEVPDLNASVFNHIQMMERTAERLSGINDVASGQVSQETRTLGEVQMATEQSFVRMDMIVRRFQEAMEELANIRHAIWKRTFAEQQQGEQPPPSMMANLEGRGVSINEALPDGKITAAIMEGAFRFKPHGSVETADPAKRRQDLMQFMQTLPMLVQTFPYLAQNLMNPLAGRSMLREVLRAFRVENQQPFLGSPMQDYVLTQGGQMMAQMGAPMGMQPPGMPGMPPGMPPMGGPPGMPPMGAPPMPGMGGPPMGPPMGGPVATPPGGMGQ